MDDLSWIDVGKVSAEKDANLSSYFYDNGVISQIIGDRTSFLILGRKGAGKTAVFQHLRDNSKEFIPTGSDLVTLSFEDYKWSVHAALVNPLAAPSLAYKQSWQFVILVESIKSLSESYEKDQVKAPKHLRKAKALIEKLFNCPIPSLKDLIGDRLMSLASIKLPKVGIGLEDGSFDEIVAGGGEVTFEEFKKEATLVQQLASNMENLISYFSDALSKSDLGNRNVFVAFDRVDEAWDGASVEQSAKVVAGLISASESIASNTDLHIRPIVFLREDIFEVLDLNDSNKLREDCGALLNWDAGSLAKMLLTRINWYAREVGSPEYSDLNELFDKKEMRQRVKPLSYILKRTMMRPRDLISYFGRVISSVKEDASDPLEPAESSFNQLTVDAIYNAEPGYSNWLNQEIQDEWKAQKPEIIQMLTAIRNQGMTVINVEVLVDHLKGTTLAQDPQGLLKFLYENSIIGFKLGSSTTWRFKSMTPSQGFVVSDEYKIHDGLVRALNLKEPRNLDN